MSSETQLVGRLRSWIIEETGEYQGVSDLVGAFCAMLGAEGIPVVRHSAFLRTLHPQLLGRTYTWDARTQGVTILPIGHDILTTDRFLKSPLVGLMEGAGAVRRRMDIPEMDLDFPILQELRAQGMTDYVALPLDFPGGFRNILTFASDRPGGFSGDELDALYRLLPYLSLRLQAMTEREVAEGLLGLYLGVDPGRRVYRGEIRRGEGVSLDAVIWLADLREFTARSDRTPQPRMIDLLNRFFEAMTVPIQKARGEVLKFMGDGLLAIFPCFDEPGCDAAERAYDATVEVAGAVGRLNRSLPPEEPPLRYGIGLHVGEVTYGNIGAEDRLDFTVIGPAVNQAARLEMMTKELGVETLMSEVFAARCRRDTISLGRQTLRGVAEPVEIFRAG